MRRMSRITPNRVPVSAQKLSFSRRDKEWIVGGRRILKILCYKQIFCAKILYQWAKIYIFYIKEGVVSYRSLMKEGGKSLHLGSVLITVAFSKTTFLKFCLFCFVYYTIKLKKTFRARIIFLKPCPFNRKSILTLIFLTIFTI